ncbi:hypothetical protein EAS64_41255 [Trebonia kvetii]|uniref:Tyr recombinase domain-containing protein n=1 Tax=Trebonia kvetii TaxID=2480626 RepID=A0A6P2BME8_9ACTN|nr:hypothetical protein EAS64_41255 [Trebonia kvetii]
MSAILIRVYCRCGPACAGRASQGRARRGSGAAAPQAPPWSAGRVEQANSARSEERRPQGGAASWSRTQDGRQHTSDLAGARVDLLDLDAGTLQIEKTRVVVDGKVIESDGKTENAQHLLALDPFTQAVLKSHVEMLDQERKDFGPEYEDDGVLFCWENGKPPHPDTITRRFKRLAKAADLPEIDLHDVRHSYATAGRNAKIDWKSLSKRIGHADVAFTMKQDVQTDLEADREVANTLADLIIGGLLVTEDTTADDQATRPTGPTRHERRFPCTNPCTTTSQRPGSLFENRALTLVAGVGFEPTTSGL